MRVWMIMVAVLVLGAGCSPGGGNSYSGLDASVLAFADAMVAQDIETLESFAAHDDMEFRVFGAHLSPPEFMSVVQGHARFSDYQTHQTTIGERFTYADGSEALVVVHRFTGSGRNDMESWVYMGSPSNGKWKFYHVYEL